MLGLQGVLNPHPLEDFRSEIGEAGEPQGAAAAFEAKAGTFLGVASGSGVEVPDWLERLGSAVDRAMEQADATPRHLNGPRPPTSLPDAVPWMPLPWNTLQAALGE